MRPSLVRIDLNALRHNYRFAQRRHGARALAVLKANAYGHGAVACAQALAQHADGFAVALLQEAVELRQAGITAPILLLEGVFDTHELHHAAQLDLWMVVHHTAQLRWIEQSPYVCNLHVWLKIDTGMRRIGFAPQQAHAIHARLRASGKVAHITLMTHFACADDTSNPATTQQLALFHAATRNLAGTRSLCNSAAILAWPQTHADWARPGIVLYGCNPLTAGDTHGKHGLLPVMHLESRIFAVRTLERGDSLGYGARFVAERPTRVGLVALGYADGYPRTAPDGTPVAIDGQRARLIGQVSMDMLTVDLSGLHAAGIGSTVQLWGNHVSASTVATAAGTTAYELLCNVKRVVRVHEAVLEQDISPAESSKEID